MPAGRRWAWPRWTGAVAKQAARAPPYCCPPPEGTHTFVAATDFVGDGLVGILVCALGGGRRRTHGAVRVQAGAQSVHEPRAYMQAEHLPRRSQLCGQAGGLTGGRAAAAVGYPSHCLARLRVWVAAIPVALADQALGCAARGHVGAAETGNADPDAHGVGCCSLQTG